MARARVYRHDLRCPHYGSNRRQAELSLRRLPLSLHPGRQSHFPFRTPPRPGPLPCTAKGAAGERLAGRWQRPC